VITFRPPSSRDDGPFRKALVLRLPPVPLWEGFINSDSIIGCYSHFADRHSTPCTEPLNPCERCKAGHAVRWRGYLGLYNFTIKKHHILEITEGAYEQMIAGLPSVRGDDIRGLWTTWARHERRATGRMMVTWDKGKRANFKLPEPFDLERIISKMYAP